MNAAWLDWFGYAASVVILVSLTMSSIVKLRWINLLGAIMFAGFGYAIGSIPTGTLNLGIAIIDVYYLIRLYRSDDGLAIVEVVPDSALFAHFWSVNRRDIERIFGVTSPPDDARAFFYLRNNNTAGILVGVERPAPPAAPHGAIVADAPSGGRAFEILIDYVTPFYRDLKIGRHFMAQERVASVLPDTVVLTASSDDAAHRKYLERMGFERDPSSPHGYRKRLRV